MKDTIFLAQKYALAFDACAKNTEEAKSNFASYQKALKNLAQIKDIIENPALAFIQKEPLLKEVLGQNIGASFIMLLVQAKRFYLAGNIEQELLCLLDKRQGFSRAQITTAFAFNDQEQQQIQKVLNDYFKTKMHLSFKEDKSILGGIVIKKDDMCIDGSILGQLKNLEQALKR